MCAQRADAGGLGPVARAREGVGWILDLGGRRADQLRAGATKAPADRVPALDRALVRAGAAVRALPDDGLALEGRGRADGDAEGARVVEALAVNA